MTSLVLPITAPSPAARRSLCARCALLTGATAPLATLALALVAPATSRADVSRGSVDSTAAVAAPTCLSAFALFPVPNARMPQVSSVRVSLAISVTETTVSVLAKSGVQVPGEVAADEAAGVWEFTPSAGTLPPGDYLVRMSARSAYDAVLASPEVLQREWRFSVTDLAESASTVFLPTVLRRASRPRPVLTTLSSSPHVPHVLFGSVKAPDGSGHSITWSTDAGRTWQSLPWSGAVPSDERVDPATSTLGTAIVRRGDSAQMVRLLVSEDGSSHVPILRLFRSGDFGRTWARAVPFSPGPNVGVTYRAHFGTIHPSPFESDRLLLSQSGDAYGFVPGGGAFPGGGVPIDMRWSKLLLSEDAGLTWREISGLRDPVPSPVVRDRVYAVNPDGAFQQSDDNARSWTTKRFPPIELVPDASDGRVLFGVCRTRNPDDTRGLVSADGGDSWQYWAAQPCPTRMRQLIAVGRPSRGLIARCDDGIYQSRNGGLSWKHVRAQAGDLLVPDLARKGRVLWVHEDGVHESDNLGDTWNRITPTYPGQ